MQNTNNKHLHTPPPNLLRGILTAVLSITIGILTISWFIIDYQLERLVIKRTSEYAHSIARIAADSSAEALLSDDKLQLNLLVQNVAKDTYIRQATIISEDGQIVTQFPEEIEQTSLLQSIEDRSDFSLFDDSLAPIKPESTAIITEKQNPKKQPAFIVRQRNKIFFEPITYQDITAGWFKLEIDKFQLEQDFREVFVEIQLMIIAITVILFALLLLIVNRFDKSIRQLAVSCQHLLIQNGIKPATKKSSWLISLTALSQSHPQRLFEHVSLPKQTEHWLNSRVVDKTLACYLEFNLQVQDDQAIAKNLTQAEIFLNKATQAYGVQSQGDILSGCLIPFVEVTPTGSQLLTEAVSLIYLIEKLFSLLDTEIQFKAFLLRAPVLYLDDEHDITTGISLMGQSMDKIKQLSLVSHFGDIVSLSIPPEELDETVQIATIVCDGIEDKNLFKLVDTHSSIQQQIARKFKYISTR